MYQIKELIRTMEDAEYGFMGWLVLILIIVLFILVAVMIIILITAVISGFIDSKISQKSSVTVNVECISRKKSTDSSIMPIPTGITIFLLSRQSISYKTIFQYDGMKLESNSESIYDAVKEGETYTAEIEIRTYPNSAKKEYDIISINTDN